MSTENGHLGGNRTPIHGVAVRCIAILPLGVGIGARIRTLTYSFGDCRAKPLTLHLHNKKSP